MSADDWSIPTNTEPPSGYDSSKWMVDEDGRSVDLPFAIYGASSVGLRVVARCVTQEDAEYIVQLHEEKRGR